jgi:hypothetical protein
MEFTKLTKCIVSKLYSKNAFEVQAARKALWTYPGYPANWPSTICFRSEQADTNMKIHQEKDPHSIVLATDIFAVECVLAMYSQQSLFLMHPYRKQVVVFMRHSFREVKASNWESAREWADTFQNDFELPDTTKLHDSEVLCLRTLIVPELCDQKSLDNKATFQFIRNVKTNVIRKVGAVGDVSDFHPLQVVVLDVSKNSITLEWLETHATFQEMEQTMAGQALDCAHMLAAVASFFATNKKTCVISAFETAHNFQFISITEE